MRGINVAVGAGIAAVVVGTVACHGEDKAEANYKKCLAKEAAGDLIAASNACVAAAYMDDPTSKSGKAAKAKLDEMKPAYEKAKKAQDEADAKEKEEKAKAAEVARVANQKAQAARLATAISATTIERASWSDGSCLSVNLPPRAYRFQATPADADVIASIGGCSRRHDVTSLEQCCPADFEERLRAAKE